MKKSSGRRSLATVTPLAPRPTEPGSGVSVLSPPYDWYQDMVDSTVAKEETRFRDLEVRYDAQLREAQVEWAHEREHLEAVAASWEARCRALAADRDTLQSKLTAARRELEALQCPV